MGTPGVSPGTFAMLGYEGTVPAGVRPVAELTVPPARPADAPVREKYEIKGRC